MTPTTPTENTTTARNPTPGWPVPPAVALTGYLLLVLAANLTWEHLPPLDLAGVLRVPVGALLAGLCLTARDLLHDTLGTRGVALGIAAGTALSALLASPRIALASAVAFALSEALDTLVYARLRHRTRLGAIAASNTAGLVIDTAVFIPMALGDSTLITGQLAGKTAATALTLAALHAWASTRRSWS